MHVAILTQYYKPEPLPKAHELAEGLVERGHTVTVVTGLPNYPSGRLYEGYRIRPWTIEDEGGVRVVRLPLYPNHGQSALPRILNYLSFATTAAFLGPLFIRHPDVLFVMHPPLTVGIPALLMAEIHRIPFVYGVADLWPEAVIAAGMLRPGRVTDVLGRFAHFVYRRAAVVAPVTELMMEHLAAEGVPRRKLSVISDWADESLYAPVPSDRGLATRLGLADRFNVLFAGQLGIVQKLGTILEAADLLRNKDDVQFVIVGNGVERERLVQEANKRHLTNVRFLGRHPASDMPAIFALADVLLVHLSADATFALNIPSKVYAYMASAKPLLAAVTGAAADLVESVGGGITCPPEDPQALAAAVMRLRSLAVEEREEMGRRAREAFLRGYSRSVVIDNFEKLLLAVVLAMRRPERLSDPKRDEKTP